MRRRKVWSWVELESVWVPKAMQHLGDECDRVLLCDDVYVCVCREQKSNEQLR